MRDRGRAARLAVVSCLIAEALIDKLQHKSTSHHLSLKRAFLLSCSLQTALKRE